jgi:WD40 repeat protein
MISKAVKWKVSTALTLTAVVTAAGIGWSRSLSESETTLSQFKPGLLTQYSSSFKDNSGWIYAIALSPDGKTLASGSYRGIIKIWNLQTAKLLYTLKAHTDAIESLAISPDGNLLASGSWDNRIKLWNLKTGILINTLKGHADDVKAISISPVECYSLLEVRTKL